MADIWVDVDTAVVVPVNILPLLDDTDFKTIEIAVVYNSAGMALTWNFVTTAGVITGTAVTPTTGGDYDWSEPIADKGMYAIEIPASAGASINNDTEGFGWFTGVATGVLPWRGPIIGFRKASMNNIMVDNGALQDNLEDMFDGTGYAGGTTKLGVNLVQILAAAITGTAAQIVAAFTKWFNVATPTGTVNSIPDAVAGAENGIAIVGSVMGKSPATLAAADVSGNLPADVKAITVGVDLSAAMKESVNSEVDLALEDAGVTVARTGYMDKLNITGNVASSAEVTAIQNNTRIRFIPPAIIERPDSDPQTYSIDLYLYDDAGNMETPDSAPTLAVENHSGTDRSGRLDSTTMALIATGHYRAIYTASSSDPLEALRWESTVVEGGVTRKHGAQSLIVDTTAVDFTAEDRGNLETLLGLADTYGVKLDPDYDAAKTAAQAGDGMVASNVDDIVSGVFAHMMPDFEDTFEAEIENINDSITAAYSAIESLGAPFQTNDARLSLLSRIIQNINNTTMTWKRGDPFKRFVFALMANGQNLPSTYIVFGGGIVTLSANGESVVLDGTIGVDWTVSRVGGYPLVGTPLAFELTEAGIAKIPTGFDNGLMSVQCYFWNDQDSMGPDYWESAPQMFPVMISTVGSLLADLHDEAFGQWTLDPVAKTLTLLRKNGDPLKVFDLTSTDADVPAFIGRNPR